MQKKASLRIHVSQYACCGKKHVQVQRGLSLEAHILPEVISNGAESKAHAAPFRSSHGSFADAAQ